MWANVTYSVSWPLVVVSFFFLSAMRLTCPKQHHLGGFYFGCSFEYLGSTHPHWDTRRKCWHVSTHDPLPVPSLLSITLSLPSPLGGCFPKTVPQIECSFSATCLAAQSCKPAPLKMTILRFHCKICLPPNLSRGMKTAHPYKLMGKSWHSCQSIRKDRPLLQTDRDVQTWSGGNTHRRSPIPQLPSSAHINIPSMVLGFLIFSNIQNFSPPIWDV